MQDMYFYTSHAQRKQCGCSIENVQCVCLADLCVTANNVMSANEKPKFLRARLTNIQPAQPTRCYRKYGSHLHLISPTGKRFHMRLYFHAKLVLRLNSWFVLWPVRSRHILSCVFFFFHINYLQYTIIHALFSCGNTTFTFHEPLTFSFVVVAAAAVAPRRGFVTGLIY